MTNTNKQYELNTGHMYQGLRIASIAISKLDMLISTRKCQKVILFQPILFRVHQKFLKLASGVLCAPRPVCFDLCKFNPNLFNNSKATIKHKDTYG